MSALHLTRVAYGCTSLDMLAERIAERAGSDGQIFLTTRHCPKRTAELEGGSLYWIVRHKLVARSRLLGFVENPDGPGHNMLVEARLMLVRPHPCRAHQGWRYLDGANAPEDLGWAGEGGGELPEELSGDLLELGLI